MKYLNVISMKEIKNEIDNFLKLKEIYIDTKEAFGLKSVCDIYAEINVPNFNKSSVDGYAIVHLDSAGASETSPVMLKQIESYKIGVNNLAQINSGVCQYVVTGGMLPKNCSGVVKVEDCEIFGENILIKTQLSKNEGVILIGEDVSKSDLVLSKGTIFSNRDIALLLSLGIKNVKVQKPLSCVVISSGDELVDHLDELTIGKIYDVNTFLIANEVAKYGVNVIDKVVLKDDYDLYLNTLKSYDVDLYITSGGSSKGNEDYTANVFDSLTSNVICHGINTKPGKPTILATKEDKMYLGLPGNPVSAFIVLHQLFSSKKSVSLAISENVNSDHGKSTVMLVKVENNVAIPIYFRSSYLNCLADADGYFVISENLEGVNQGELVEVLLFE